MATTTYTFNRDTWLRRFWKWITLYNWRLNRHYKGKKIIVEGKEYTISKYKSATLTVKGQLPDNLNSDSAFMLPPTSQPAQPDHHPKQ